MYMKVRTSLKLLYGRKERHRAITGTKNKSILRNTMLINRNMLILSGLDNTCNHKRYQ